MKLEMDIDLRIVGFNYGSKGTKNESVISVLQLESECGLLKTAPGGMTEAMMADITNRQEEWVQLYRLDVVVFQKQIKVGQRNTHQLKN
jgi:hypothetical protein